MTQQQLDPPRANQLALYYILVSIGIGMLGSLANHLLGTTSTNLPYLLTLTGLTCLIVWLGFVCKRCDALALGFSRISWTSTLSLFVWLTIVGEGITAFTLTWFPEQLVEQLLTAFTPESVWSWLVFLVMASLVAPIGEEIVFRGFILNSYAQAIGAHRAVWISAILFGLAHHSPPHVVAAFFSGLVFARFVMAGGSLWASIVAHGLVNFSSTAMMHFNRSPLIFPEYETTEAGGIAGLLIAIIATFLFFKYHPVTRSIEPRQQQPIISAALIGYLIITFSLTTLDLLSTLSVSPVTIPAH
ncbi:MAG: type II CAAX endopeptidase family protein [Methylococcaceae bacterium]